MHRPRATVAAMADRRCSRDGHSGERGALTVAVVISLTGTVLLSPTSGGWIIIILEADENPEDEDSRTATEIPDPLPECAVVAIS
ncbi:hypothetical protein SESBI_34101 [Sesbania bispinosa]|nr:hypothetical protein SESBI_34101 [Sesbania bispinosa]